MIYEEYSIVQKAIHGDSEAYEYLVKKYNTYFYKVAFLYLKNEQDSLDAVQESIYQGFIKIRSLRKPEYFVTWMNRIVINQALKSIRKRSCYEPYEEQGVQETAADMKLEEKIDLYHALKKLRQKERDAIVLQYFYDKPIAEIALILQTPENSVKTILKRAKERLKKILKEDYFEY